MTDRLASLLQTQQIQRVSHDAISFVHTKDANAGLDVAKKLLTGFVDRKTVVFLSGGRTPETLYQQLAQDESFHAGAVALVDERYGNRFHAASNERMIANTGLLSHLEKKQIPFYPILQDVSLEQTAKQYDETSRSLLTNFPKSIAILGIGVDGHTAGIPANRMTISEDEKTSYVVAFSDFPAEQKERITMTLHALSFVDILLVLVFGEDKKEALDKMIEAGSEVQIPARFFKRPDIAEKTLVITDQSL